MQVLPLSAQAGSSIFIPLGDGNAPDIFAYGGAITWDQQRGQLVLKLIDSAGNCPSDETINGNPAIDEIPECYLEAFVVTTAMAAETTDLGRGWSGREVVAVFNIPSDTPPGTYSVKLQRRFMTEGVEQLVTSPTYDPPVDVIMPDQPASKTADRKLTVLPAQLDPDQNWAACPFTDSQGGYHACGTNTITGSQKVLDYWKPWVWKWRSGWSHGWDIYPDPMVVFEVPPVNGDTVAALEMTIEYPAGLVEVVDVVQPIMDQLKATSRAIVMFADDQAGTLTVKVVAHPNQPDIHRIGVVFDLVVNASDGSFIRVDPEQFSTSVTLATDADGIDGSGFLPTLPIVGIL